MPVRVVLEGFDDLAQALHQLPDELARQAQGIVRAAAAGALEETRSGYPVGPARKDHEPGEMRRGLTSREVVAPGKFAVLDQSTTFYARFWEEGTPPRKTRKGTPRGQVSAHLNQSLWTISDRYKTRMQIELVELCRAAGFTVDHVLD